MMTAVIILYLSDQLTKLFWWSLSSGSLCEQVKHVAAPPTWTQTQLMDGASSVASFRLNYRLPARGGWFYPAGRLQDALTALITPSDGWKGRCCNVPPDTLFTDKLKHFAVWNAALWLASLQLALRPPSAREKAKITNWSPSSDRFWTWSVNTWVCVGPGHEQWLNSFLFLTLSSKSLVYPDQIFFTFSSEWKIHLLL